MYKLLKAIILKICRIVNRIVKLAGGVEGELAELVLSLESASQSPASHVP